jgi:uncharacterized membrane protein YeaQ/YmgE (transglycosylase-associated protein family)
MHLEMLLSILVVALICAVLAFLAALLLRLRLSILGYLGAGLLGSQLGGWLASVFNAGGVPGQISMTGASVHVVWAFVGALLVLLVVKFLPPLRK